MLSLIIKLSLVSLFIAALIVSTESKISRARQNFGCEEVLNDQIKMELEAATTYLSLASHYNHDSQSLKGFGKYFMHSWREENEHAEKLIEYLILRGGTPVIPMIPRPENETKWESMDSCEIFNNVLGLEMFINEHLLKVHKCGGESEDPQLQDFLDTNFMGHHVEANKELADMITRIERATQHVLPNGTKSKSCDGLGLHLIDKELSA